MPPLLSRQPRRLDSPTTPVPVVAASTLPPFPSLPFPSHSVVSLPGWLPAVVVAGRSKRDGRVPRHTIFTHPEVPCHALTRWPSSGSHRVCMCRTGPVVLRHVLPLSFLCITIKHQGLEAPRGPSSIVSVFNPGRRRRSFLALICSALLRSAPMRIMALAHTRVSYRWLPGSAPVSDSSSGTGTGFELRPAPEAALHTCPPLPSSILSVITSTACVIVFPKRQIPCSSPHVCARASSGLQRPLGRPRAPQYLATDGAARCRPPPASALASSLPTPARGFLAQQTSWR